MTSTDLLVTNVGGIEVIELSSPSTSSEEANVNPNQSLNIVYPNFIRLLFESAKTSRAGGPPMLTMSDIVTIRNARASFKRIAMLALAEMGNACELMGTIPMCLAKYLVNRRLVYLINGYIRMLNAHEAFVDGENIWTLVEARNAVYVIGQVQRGFHYLFLTAKKVADTPVEKREKLGEDLHKKYLELYGDNL